MIQRNYNANLQTSILTATNEWTSRHCLAAWMLAMEARHGAVCKDHRWMMNGLTVHLLVKSTDISVVLSLSSKSWDVISLAWLDNVRGYRNTGMQVSFVIFVPASVVRIHKVPYKQQRNRFTFTCRTAELPRLMQFAESEVRMQELWMI